jgi:hypothetical protein
MSEQLDTLRKRLEELNQPGRVVDYDEFRGLLEQFPGSITVRDLVTFRAIAKRQANLRALSPEVSGAVTPEQHDQLIAFWRQVDDKLAENLAAHVPPENATKLDDLLTEADRSEALGMLVSRMAAAERDAPRRAMNGWQRLWVVIAVMWTLVVAAFAAALWPTSTSISRGEILLQLDPADARMVEPEYLDLPWLDTAQLRSVRDLTRSGGEPLTLAQRIRALYPGKYHRYSDWRLETEARRRQPGWLDDIPTTPESPSVDVARHHVRFVDGVAETTRNRLTGEYAEVLTRLLTDARVDFTIGTFGWWAIPMSVLYAFGWAIAWVRRGFMS